MIRWLLIAIVLLLVARAFWKVVDGIMEAAGGRPSGGRRARTPSVRLVRDPVCGTHVAPGNALSLSANGSTHYFCSEECRKEFGRQRRAGARP